jgi:two-component system response regulator MprA
VTVVHRLAAPLVLVVEDDRAVRESLLRALGLEGYDVCSAADGEEALGVVAERHPHVIVLDVLMPALDGLSVCRRLRAQGDGTPILLLTARSAVPDRVSGLDAGADDYLPKPFALDELLARLRALLRRHGPDAGAETILVEDLRIEGAARRAWRAERELELSKTEFDLLELLARNAGIVLDPSTIYDKIWGYDFGPDSKNLAVYIGYLRRKTEEGGEARLIQTVRGVGYTLRRP